MSERQTATVLSIAGSDSGGGAGIQADLKAFAAAGVHGMTAVTALTAQNTVGVDAIHPVPPEIIIAQVRAVAGDIGIDAIKIGMLGDEATIAAVCTALGEVGAAVPIVLDPVMVSESGATLLDPGARSSLIDDLLPRVLVATPNLAEARELSGLGPAASGADLAAAVRALGPGAVIVTGGHSAEGIDLLDDGSGEPLMIDGPVHADGAAHGSGCTHSSTLAAYLARGADLRVAAVAARRVAARAVASGLEDLGSGPGPVDVFGLESIGG